MHDYYNARRIRAVDVFLDRRKSREYVGQLTHENRRYVFIYDDIYLFGDRSIPLGPDLPLTKKKFSATDLFPSFLDRIPSSANPAYSEYCSMVGIDPTETDLLVLVATLGQKGPSSFIFSPVMQPAIEPQDVATFRAELNLTIREFSYLFDFSPATIMRLEKHSILGKEVMKRLEVYYLFPQVALYEAIKNRAKINEEKVQYVEQFLRDKIAALDMK